MDARSLIWRIVLLILLASPAAAQQPGPPSGIRVPADPHDRHTLTITVTGTGSGAVTGPGITSCTGAAGGDCTEDYIVDTTTTIHATAASGSAFAGWSGDCTGTGVCTVTMSQARSVTATFNLATFLLTVTINAGGTVTGTGINCGADCTESYAVGTGVTLTASTSTGFVFTGWSGDCSGTSSCFVTMNQARNVTATFTPGWTLAWDDNSSDETTFSLERRTPCNTGPYSVIASSIAANTTEYTDSTNVLAGVAYQYRIQAVNDAGGSAYSNEVCTQ